MASKDLLGTVNNSVRELNNLEKDLQSALSNARRSQNYAEIASQTKTGLFHRREAIEALQRSQLETARSSTVNAQLIGSIIGYLQDITQISNAIVQLGAANIAQNRAIAQRLRDLLEGNDVQNLTDATQEELLGIIEQIDKQQDSLIKQKKTEDQVRRHDEEIESLQNVIQGIQEGRIETLKPSTVIWHSYDFTSKEDFIAKVERKEVKKGHHFVGIVGKTIDSGAFIHIATDSSNKFGWFDGFIYICDLSWEQVETTESVVTEGMEVETVIKNIRFQDNDGNDKFSVNLSLRDVTPREKNQDNSLNLDTEYSEEFVPIDTSTIETEGIYPIQISPVTEDKENIRNYLITNMKYLDNEISRLKEIELQERCSFILNGVFKQDFNSQVYLRNISMDDLRVGIRCKRFPGDWLDTELNISTKETLLIEGAFINGNRAISVSQICVVANVEECLPYEIECEIMPQNDGIQIRDTRLRNIVAKIPSLYKATADQLKLWEDYLNWRKTLVETQLIGCKYIDRYYDPTLKQIVFTLIAKDKESYNSIRGKLRDGVQAYSNNYSEKDWTFSLNRDVRIKDVTRERLGRRGKVISEFYLDEKKINVDDEKDSIITDLLKSISNPYIIKVPYSLSSQVKQYIDDNELTEEETEIYIKENILPDFPKDGFIALSAAGDFILIRRLQRAIDQLKKGENYSPRLCNWMFDSKNARPLENNVQEIEWKNKNIENNEFQKKAVLGILNAPDLFLLQGPPGTGKTTVIAEAIYQLIKQNKRVLLSSQSNDAVDEALDRLANDPNIRALRIGRKSKPKNKHDDDDVNKFSEETALSEFYKSISVQIKDDMLSDWENAGILKNQYALDLRDLRNFSSDLTDLMNENRELVKQYEDLNKQKTETERKIKELTQSTLDSQNDRLQLSNFKSFLREQPDITFYLSKVQINAIQSIIINVISSCKTNGINLLPRALDSNVLSPKDYSIYLKVLITNYKRVCELEKKLTNKGECTKENDPELLAIQQQLNIIDQKMRDPSITDEVFTELTSRQNKLMLERRKLSSGKNNTANILSGFEDLLIAPSAEIDNLITGIKTVSENYTNFISEIEKNLDDLAKNDSSYDELRLLKNEKDSIDGRIKVCTEEINQKRGEILNKQNTLSKLCEKYSLPENSSEASIAGKINELQLSNEEKLRNSSKIRDFWGDTLKTFSKRIDNVSQNITEMRYENEVYLKRYIKACNVVGISCTADPKFLEENEFTDFDVVIIDEVSKATPPELLLSLMKGRKTVLVGDHRQLPPTFGEHEGSFQTFAEQVQESDEYDDSVKAIMTMDYLKKYKDMVTSSLFKKHFDNPEMDARLKGSLRYQYRMHSDIMRIVNNFYPGEEKLIAGWKPEEENGPVKYDGNHKLISGIKNHMLKIGTETVPNFIIPEKHAYWIDSSKTPSNKPNFATTRGTSTSICNLLEQKMTLNLLELIDKQYVEMGFPEKNLDEKGRPHKVSVGVICLYQLQVNDLRDKLYKIKKNPERKYKAIDVTCNTIDRFQGQEKEIIIVNLVCNKPINTLRGPRGSEHITSYERINVAFSRAQKLLVIMGAQEYFKEINVELPTENNSVVTRQVYRDIYSDLHNRACFFGSSALISKQDEIDIEKEKQEIINEKKELEEEKRQANNRSKRGY